MITIIVAGPDRAVTGTQADGPGVDYVLVAERLGANVLHWQPSPAALSGSKLWRVARSFGGNMMEARALLHRLPPGALVYATGETWGLPVALAAHAMRTRLTHVMYVHRVFSPRWLRFLRRNRERLHVDGWICVTESQADLLRSVLGSDAAVTAISQGVDTDFWDPAKAAPYQGEPYILSVGTEMRNYPLLFEAVRGLDMRVVVKASSAWMRGARASLGTPPPNVEILTERLSYVELRDLYAGASVVVVPLQDTPQAAGITTILEAMAMGKCVVATESQGLPDVLQDRVTGRVVAGEPRALREALQALWYDAEERERLAQAGYTAVRAECSLEQHAARVVAFIRQVAAEKQDVSATP